MGGVVEWVVGGPDPEQVMRDTWGHLDAEVGVQHPGTILFAQTVSGEQFILSYDFGETAGHGPWFWDGLHQWLYSQETEDGAVYRFTGYYLLTRHDVHKFVGDVEQLNITTERKVS